MSNFTIKCHRADGVRHVFSGHAFGVGVDTVNITMRDAEGKETFQQRHVGREEGQYERIEVLNAAGVAIDELKAAPRLSEEAKQMIAAAANKAVPRGRSRKK